MSEEKGHWWITTGVKTANGHKVLGPFESRTLAIQVRTYMETARSRVGAYWVERLADIPVEGETK